MNNLRSEKTALLSEARRLMAKVFGFHDFRPGQESILEAIFAGEDTLVVMPTGAGKSLCYQLPALVLPGTTLVISPLIALIKDQVDSLRVMDLPAASLHSLMSLTEQEKVLKNLAAGAYKMVYVAPERLRHGPFLHALGKQNVSLVAVDEAHCISEWGHDFRPDYLRIGQALDGLGRPQTVALTATATERVREDIVRHLGLRSPRPFITGFDRKNLHLEVAHVRGAKEKLAVLTRRLKNLKGSALVYTGTRKNVEALVDHLRREGIEAGGYHAGMEDAERNRVQEAFLEGRMDLVVATNAFGMGIDRSDIRLVVHHQLPGTVEAYYQECGRAGRDGEAARCLLLFSAADRRLQEFFIEAAYPSRQVILEIYERLLERPESPIWLTYPEIGALCRPAAAEMAVASSLKILEDAGVVHRLHRQEKQAEFFLKMKPALLLRSVSKKFPAKAEFLKILGNHYTEDELLEGIRFLPDELAADCRISGETLKKIMADLGARGEGTYIAPFHGRGLRLLRRVPAAELGINFERLELRRAHELEKLNRIIAYGALNRCRRAFLLEYFGESYARENCGGCDICNSRRAGPAPEMIKDPLLGLKILSGVARLRGRFGEGMAVKMLAGSREKAMERFRLNRLSTYGLLGEFKQEQVEKWMRELTALGLLKQERTVLGAKSYPVVVLTSRGEEVMRKREAIALSAPVSSQATTAEPPAESEFDEGLFEELRRLRLQLARGEGLPPYCIFHDRTLREMACRNPQTKPEMLAVAGVGEVKFLKYGRSFLELILSRRR